MNYVNYVLLFLLNYKIELCECLEYSITSYEYNKDDLKKRLDFLSNEFYEGRYQKIISSLFENSKILSKPINTFLKKYSFNKIANLTKQKKLSIYIKYNEHLIDAITYINELINSFTSEKEIYNKLNAKIIQLIDITNNHFYNFLFFNCYNLCLNCFYNEENSLISTSKSSKRLSALIKYCQTKKDFTKSIDILYQDDKEKVYEELKSVSNLCLQTEKKQNELLKEVNNIIDIELKKGIK